VAAPSSTDAKEEVDREEVHREEERNHEEKSQVDREEARFKAVGDRRRALLPSSGDARPSCGPTNVAAGRASSSPENDGLGFPRVGFGWSTPAGENWP